MRVAQAARHVGDHVHHDARLEASAGCRAQHCAKIGAIDQLAHDVARLFVDIEHGRDVRVPERRCQRSFAPKRGDPVSGSQQIRLRQLDRDALLEVATDLTNRLPSRAHTASTKLADERKLVDSVPCARHVFVSPAGSRLVYRQAAAVSTKLAAEAGSRTHWIC
jgi:hypothetical protein